MECQIRVPPGDPHVYLTPPKSVLLPAIMYSSFSPSQLRSLNSDFAHPVPFCPECLSLVFEFSRAIITKDHKHGDLKQHTFVAQSSRGQKSEIKVFTG